MLDGVFETAVETGGGFSADAAVRIGGNDRAGLERLLRYCQSVAVGMKWLPSRRWKS